MDQQSTRKNETEQQENTVLKLKDNLEKNQTKIGVTALVAVALIVVIYFFMTNMKESEIENNNLASTALGRVQPYLAQGDYAKALYGDSAKTIRGERIIGLIELVDNYGSTKTGKVAALYAGNALFTNGEADKAIDYYEMALESTSKTIIMGANAGMATCYEHKGEYQTAADYYEKAAQLTITPDVALRYKYFMGLCYEKAGATSDAEKVYREIIRENEYSDYADYAKSSLIRIGTIIE